MERKKFLKAIALISFAPALLAAACKEPAKRPEVTGSRKMYTCSMHPQIVRDEPGTCPICGMELVPFDKDRQDAALTLNDNQIALANITTVTVGTGAVSNFRQLNGRLVTDPAKTVFISSRVPGRVEALYIKETGVKVTQGQPLYKIYSEQLATLQQEYLLASAQVKQFPDDTRFRQIEKAARQKLVLYDQTEEQMDRLLQAQKVNPYITYPATTNGIVAEVLISEGQYVQEGGTILRLEGYNRLWAEADLYPAEASSVHVGQSVKVVVAGWENKPQTMTIQFINPAFQNGSQVMQVRGTVSNPDNSWQPGMQANIFLPLKSRGDVISLPVDAVIRDGKGSHVWIEKAKGKFEPRMIKTGLENFDVVEITEGLQSGDQVVVTGAYLLYSENVLKKGAGMSGMDMGGQKH